MAPLIDAIVPLVSLSKPQNSLRGKAIRRVDKCASLRYSVPGFLRQAKPIISALGDP